MVEIIKSPDGKHVMSENSDLPEHLKSNSNFQLDNGFQ